MTEEQSEIRYSDDTDTVSDTLFANEISTSTLVSVLINKGIVTTNEIIEAERHVRLKQFISEEQQNQQRQKKKLSFRLKKWASKKRWSRRLTARLFGWEWKRQKTVNQTDNPA